MVRCRSSSITGTRIVWSAGVRAAMIGRVVQEGVARFSSGWNSFIARAIRSGPRQDVDRAGSPLLTSSSWSA